MNLYAYAGANPVMFADPFGLRAMDVEYGDKETEAYVTALRKASKTFDKALRAAENDKGVLVRFEKGVAPTCQSGGCAEYKGVNSKGQREFRVSYDMQGIVGDNAYMGFISGGTAAVDVFTTLGHEFYGDVAPGVDSAGNFTCGDGPPGTRASQSCAVNRENDIRKDLGRVLRPQY